MELKIAYLEASRKTFGQRKTDGTHEKCKWALINQLSEDGQAFISIFKFILAIARDMLLQ